MATIRLVPDKVNMMPEYISGAECAFREMGASLFSLRDAASLISPEIISMDDVTAGAREAAEFCGEVEASLGSFREGMENFIQTVVKVDMDVATLIEQRTEEFYKKYEHLRPECEKDFWDKAADWFKGAAEWCKENWKLVALIVLTVAAIVACIFLPALAPLAMAVLKGIIIGAIRGAISGGLMNGIISVMNGGSFWEGFLEGAINGAIDGGLMGALGGLGGGLGDMLSICSKAPKLVNGIKIAGKVLGYMDDALDGFDLAALGLGLIAPGNALTELNNQLHSSDLYNGITYGISMMAAFTGGMADALNCFVAGTLVLTAAGLVAIEKIKAGDLVMAADENGNRGLKRVVRTFARQTESIVTVNAGEMAIRCTPEHPFFVEGKGFVFAGDLEPGNILVTSDGGCVMVTSVDADDSVNADNTVTVYNFEVEDWHTYFVGEDGVLVHNTCTKLEMTYDDYLEMVENLDVSTEPNTAVFYSGPGNRQIAEEFAKINGKTTLEMTPGGKYLDSLDLFSENSTLTTEQAYEIWSRLSARYAQGASGNAYGFVRGSKSTSVFNTTEYPELLNNPDITNIFTELLN